MKEEIHDICVPSASQEMENIAFVFGQSPHVHIGVVDQKFDAFDVVLKDSIVKSSVTLFALEIDVVRVSDLL